MLLELHCEYTYQALSEITNIDKEKAKEILKGSFVNDLCELTNKYTKINNSLDKYIQMKSEKGLLDYSAFYQSHWGDLSALHCMANIKNESSDITYNKIINWLKFLEFIIFNIDETMLEKKINEFQNILGEQVCKLKFKLSNLFDTNDIFEAKYRAIGMIVHIIEDSYTLSHCKREGLFITEFYCYSEQSAKKHKMNDYVLKDCEKSLVLNIKEVLNSLLQEHSAETNYTQIFKLAETNSPSSCGGFSQ